MWKQLRLCHATKQAGQLFKRILLFAAKIVFTETVRQAIKKWFEELFK